MSQFWRSSAATGVGLFLETCAFYLIIGIVSATIQMAEAGLSFWLVFLSLLCAFLVSKYVMVIPLSRNLRGIVGLTASVVLLLLLSHFNSDSGLMPFGEVFTGDKDTAINLVLGLGFLLLPWWRGVTMAFDEVSLTTVRSSFRWGLGALFLAVMVESFSSVQVVNGYLVVGFFIVGLAGLALARFSWEAGESQEMSASWLLPIAISVAAVIALGLLISAAGLGGLDDVTRSAVRTGAAIGFLILKPILFGLGYLAALVLQLASNLFGGEDRSGFEYAQDQARQFHEQLENTPSEGGLPTALVVFLKLSAFLVVTGLTGWLLYNLFRVRRMLRRPAQVLETRQSLFSWSRANRDFFSFLSEWWGNLVALRSVKDNDAADPSNVRECYHGLLVMAESAGCPRWEWQTPKEHQRMLGNLLPQGPVARIVDGFQSAHYGQAQLNDQEFDRLHRDWSSIREFLADQERAEYVVPTDAG